MDRQISLYERIFQKTDTEPIWTTKDIYDRERCYVYSKDPTKLGEWRYRQASPPRRASRKASLPRPATSFNEKRPLPPIPSGPKGDGLIDDRNKKASKKRKSSTKSKMASKGRSKLSKRKRRRSVNPASSESSTQSEISSDRKSRQSRRSKSSEKSKTSQESVKSKSKVSKRRSLLHFKRSKHSVKAKPQKDKTKLKEKKHKSSVKATVSQFLKHRAVKRGSMKKSGKQKDSAKAKLSEDSSVLTDEPKPTKPKREKGPNKTKKEVEKLISQAKGVCLRLKARVQNQIKDLWDLRHKKFKKTSKKAKTDVKGEQDGSKQDTDSSDDDNKGKKKPKKKKKKGEVEGERASVRPYTTRTGVTHEMMYGSENRKPVPFLEVAGNCGCGCLYICSMIKVD